MNTKVEEALGVVGGGRYVIPSNGLPRGIVFVGEQADALEQARTTLAAHIAQQDATIARLEADLKICHDAALAARAALNQGEGK